MVNVLTAPAGRRVFLREGTRALHDELDARAAGLDLRDPADYAALLLEHASALCPLETRLELSDVDVLLPDWVLRRRRAALATDLAGLGRASPVNALPAFEASAAPLTRSEAFGVLYVLEGSRLGGAVMAKAAATSASNAVRSNLRYFTHGQGAGLWPSFLARLEEAPGLAPAGLLAGATLAFSSFLAAGGPAQGVRSTVPSIPFPSPAP